MKARKETERLKRSRKKGECRTKADVVRTAQMKIGKEYSVSVEACECVADGRKLSENYVRHLLAESPAFFASRLPSALSRAFLFAFLYLGCGSISERMEKLL